jgi:3-dehydro-L-gulonate 2-dehydrogenase
MNRISAEKIIEVMIEKLKKHGVEDDQIARECAELLTQNSIDGIYSHGVNRFPRLVSYLDKGYIKPNNKPTLIASYGAVEKWDGNLGMGNTNAKMSMDRAIELAKEFGIGCVAIRNTNHWMRGGSYGLQAADAGCVAICWTNTQPNMPAWGAKDRRIGNNPLILCIPRNEGHVMMDGAMAQFSYGAIESAKFAGKQLPVPGGYDTKGNITTDPAEIEKTWRVLPIGFWKGSGISIVLDMIAAALSDGNTVTEVGRLSEDEYALSQVMIAIDVERISQSREDVIKTIIDDIKASEKVNEGQEILYPNEPSYIVREENLKMGIPVHDEVWEQILAL